MDEPLKNVIIAVILMLIGAGWGTYTRRKKQKREQAEALKNKK